MKKVSKLVVIVIMGVLLFFGYRRVVCPPMLPIEDTSFSDKEKETIGVVIDSNIISLKTVAQELQDKKIILAGEIHFQEKVMQKFNEFLELLPVDKFTLTLELPSNIQPEIDRYMNTGDLQYLEKINECSNCLPYSGIVKWCYEHKSKLNGVFAIDENRTEIILKRAFCYDSRNKTMTKRIIRIQEASSNIPVIFYGGQLHCLQSGRYLYDVKNREPIGSRLQESFPRDDISTILFSGNGSFVSSEAWGQKIGVFPINKQTEKLERRYFIHEPVKGSEYCGDFFNYFVNAGDLD